MSLRQRKKAQTRQLLIDVASDLFRTPGYEATTMRDIAAAAEVSYQTLYNYFATKADLAMAMLSADMEDTAAHIDALVSNYQTDVLACLAGLNRLRLASVSQRDRAIWREVCADVMQQKQKAAGLYAVVDASAHRTLEQVLFKARDNGQLTDKLDITLAAHTLYVLSEFAFVEYVMDDNAEAEAQLSRLNAQSRLLLSPYLNA